MSVPRRINHLLARTTGLRVVRARHTAAGLPVAQGRRLLRAPIFVLAPVRSGSTLLRMMLGSHSSLYAPHELHLDDVRVRLASWYGTHGMGQLGFDERELTNMLWDRLLAEALHRSGKRTLVDKTPSHVFQYRRLAEIWPDARFVFLLRHPGAIYRSWHEARGHLDTEQAVTGTLRYLTAVDQARHELPGPQVRYEQLAAEPAAQTRRLCAQLGLPWEPTMINYGGADERFTRGLGDWTDRIRTGRPQPPRPDPAPDEVPEALHALCRSWGYLPVADAGTTSKSSDTTTAGVRSGRP